MKKCDNKSKGITLVALIVTVIILLILAGISIASLTGNGLFEKVKLAKEKQENAEIKENIIFGDYENKINETAGSSVRENQNNKSKVIWNGKLNPKEKLDLDMSEYDYIELYILGEHHTKILKFDLTKPVATNYISGYDFITSITSVNSIQSNSTIWFDFCEFAVNKEKNNLYFYRQGYTSFNTSNNSGSTNTNWTNENSYVYRITGGNY